MRRRAAFLAAFVSLVFAALAGTPITTPLPPIKFARVDAAIQAEMDKEKVVGLAIGVIQNGQVVYLKGYGLADREKNAPVTTATMFRWASCSKPLAATAAMQLVEKGKLDLDADVRKYVPEFPDKGVTITVRELLCHQSGIVHYTNGKVIVTHGDYKTAHPFADPVVALDKFKESPLLFDPGAKYSYSSHGYVLLSAVIQRAGGEPFADQVADRIANPLGLSTLQPDYQWKVISNRAVGHVLHDGTVVRSTDTDQSWKYGAGGYISDVRDFAAFAASFLHHDMIKAETETQMWTPQKTSDGKATDFGLGFVVQMENGRLIKVSHDGAQEKTRTRLVLYPARNDGVVVMSNSEWVNPGTFTTLIYKALAGD